MILWKISSTKERKFVSSGFGESVSSGHWVHKKTAKKCTINLRYIESLRTETMRNPIKVTNFKWIFNHEICPIYPKSDISVSVICEICCDFYDENLRDLIILFIEILVYTVGNFIQKLIILMRGHFLSLCGNKTKASCTRIDFHAESVLVSISYQNQYMGSKIRSICSDSHLWFQISFLLVTITTQKTQARSQDWYERMGHLNFKGLTMRWLS